MPKQFCTLTMFITHHLRSQFPKSSEWVGEGEGYGETAEEEIADRQIDHKNISRRSHRLQVRVWKYARLKVWKSERVKEWKFEKVKVWKSESVKKWSQNLFLVFLLTAMSFV